MHLNVKSADPLSFSIIFGTGNGTFVRGWRSILNRVNWPQRASACFLRACRKLNEKNAGDVAKSLSLELRRAWIARDGEAGNGFRLTVHSAENLEASDLCESLRRFLIEELNREFAQSLQL